MKQIKILSIVIILAIAAFVLPPYMILENKAVTFPGTDIVSSASTVAVTGVKLNKTTATLNVKGTLQLTATVSPATATDKTVSWKSSNAKVATVSSKGKVTAIAKGSAKITVTTKDGGKTASCTVTVSQGVTGVKLSKTTLSLKKGATSKLVATVLPATASNNKVTWKSSSTAIVTVSSAGVVTGKSKGTATVTVTTVDGKKTSNCKVTVK